MAYTILDVSQLLTEITSKLKHGYEDYIMCIFHHPSGPRLVHVQNCVKADLLEVLDKIFFDVVIQS